MQRLNLKAMAAMEKATLPKFEKVINAIYDLPIEDSVKNELTTTIANAHRKAQEEIISIAWTTPKPATRKPRKAKAADDDTDIGRVNPSPINRTRKPRKQASLFDQAIESGEAELILDTDDDL